jgi:T5SS/PEP-CTERM-associated repeat protein
MSPRRIHRLLAICASAALASCSIPALADPRIWSNSAGGSFNVSTNWSGGNIPGPSDSALFDLGSAYTVTFPTSPTNTKLIVGNDNVTFNLLANTYTLSSLLALPTSPSVAVGEISTDNAVFRLTNGTLLDQYAVIGKDSGSHGNVTILSTGYWNNLNDLDIGYSGQAQLTIQSNARVDSANATIGDLASGSGNVTIDGVNSRWDIANDLFAKLGTSTFTIRNGGALTDSNAFLSPSLSSSSTANIFGAGSLWSTAHSLEIAGSGGPAGPATLNVGVAAPGGAVTATDAIKIWNLGKVVQAGGEIRTPLLEIQGGSVNNTNGILTVDPAPSPFATNGVYIGINATGNLNISAGGKLTTNHEAYIGVYGSSVGDVTLDGAGSNWTVNSPLTIGDAGKGILTLDNGASASSIVETRIGFAAGSTGSVTVNGASATDPSSFTTTGFIDVGTFGTGFLSITNQGFVSSGTAVVGRNAGSKGTVKISDNFAELRATSLYIGGDNVGPGGIGTVNVSNNGVLTVTGPITVWTAGTLQSYPVSIAATELRLRGGKFSAWSNFNAPISNGGGTIEVPGSNILFLNNTLTSLPGSLLQRIGTGDLFINGPQNHAPNSTFHATGGQTFLRSNAGIPATFLFPATANLNVTVGPGSAKIVLLASQVLHQLNVNTANAGRQAFDLNSPNAAGAFSAVSIYTPATKPDVWAAIVNANRAGAPDPQDGIFDSGLSSHPNSRLGLAKLTDIGGDSYLLIRSTRIGDLNLDGTVTIADFIDLSSNFGASGPNITWQEGDLNYDNAVTISDFIDLSSNFGSSYAGTSLHSSSVPEPSTLLFLLSPALLLLHRPCIRTGSQRKRHLATHL